MIDVKNKKIINGHGSVGVAVVESSLILCQPTVPFEIGSVRELSEEEQAMSIGFSLSVSEWDYLMSSLSLITEESQSFEFRCWTIYFERDFKKSVAIWKRYLLSMDRFTRLLSC